MTDKREWVLVPKDAIERAIETLENDGDEHGEGRNLRAAIDEAAAPQPPSGGDSEPMTGDLLPCPFCGKSNQDRYPCEWLDGSGANVIRCAWCHGAAPMNVWNRRTAPPSAPVGVEWPLSLLRPGHWSEVYVGHRCMRLEVTYDYKTWERLMEQVEAALAQQPAAVDGYTTGHCERNKQPGGCDLHNLRCGWPACDRRPAAQPGGES